MRPFKIQGLAEILLVHIPIPFGGFNIDILFQHFDVDIHCVNPSFLLELSEMGDFPSYFCYPFQSIHNVVHIQAPHLETIKKRTGKVSHFLFIFF